MPPMQEPLMAKQPEVRLKPFAAVEVAEPVMFRLATSRPDVKVDVADAFEVRIPVLLIVKSVVVALAVEEAMAKRVVAVEPF